MIHLIHDPGLLTVVVDDQDAVMEGILATIRSGLVGAPGATAVLT